MTEPTKLYEAEEDEILTTPWSQVLLTIAVLHIASLLAICLIVQIFASN